MADTGTPGKHVIGALKPTEFCIALEDLDQYREGIGPPELRKRVQTHLEKCAHCRTELTLLEDFAAGDVRPGEELQVQWIVKKLEDRSPRSSVAVSDARAPARRTKPRWFTNWRLGPAIIFAAVVLMVAYFWNLRSSVPGPLQPDRDSGREVLRTNAISTITPRGDVTAVPETFRWHAIQSATRYRVQLMEVDGTLLWTSEVSDAEVSVRPDVAARIVPAKTLVWRVEAIDSRGVIVGRSDAQRFRLVVNVK